MAIEYVGGFVQGRDLFLLYRSAEGELRRRRVPAEYVSFIRAGIDPAVRREIERSQWVRGVKRDGDWLRVTWDSYDARAASLLKQDGENWFEEHDAEQFEADVSPLRRYFADSGAETTAAPRVAFLDIETDSRVPFSKRLEMRVLCWAVVAGCDCPEAGIKKGDTWSGCIEADTNEAEAELLGRLWETLKPFDCIAAWYGAGFDFPVLEARTEKRLPRQDLKRWRFLDQLEVYKKLNRGESGEEKQSLKLESVAQALLGEGKHNFDAGKTYEAWAAGGEERERLLRYNIQDTQLLLKIEDKTGLIRLFGGICKACRLFVETWSLHSTQQADGFMLRLGVERGIRFPTRLRTEHVERDDFEGAFVLPPSCKGIARNVHVADFASLYPSIILTWNMSPETLGQVCASTQPENRPEGYARASTGWTFRQDVDGILPAALAELIRLRKYWNDLKASLPPGTSEWHAADIYSTAYKVVANSFYGVIGSPFSRYHDRRIAESVTQCGVWLIRQTMDQARKQGIEVVYGDTDSFFTTNTSRERFEAFVGWCNREFYPGLLERVGCRAERNTIKLAYEKEFDWLVFTSAKRYVGGYAHYKGKAATAESKPEIRGLEFRRGDTIKLARNLQGAVIDRLQARQWDIDGFVGLVMQARSRIVHEPLELDDVALSKSLSKPVKEYQGKSLQPHVRVAKMLQERGQDVSPGTRIRFVVIDGSVSPMEVIPAEDWQGDCDRYVLWEKTVYPATQRLLEAAFPDHDWAGYCKVRPPKPRRGRASKVDPGQGALALDGARSDDPTSERAAGPGREIDAAKGALRASTPHEAPAATRVAVEQPSLATLRGSVDAEAPLPSRRALRSRPVVLRGSTLDGFGERSIAAIRAILLTADDGPRPVRLDLAIHGKGVVGLQLERRIRATPEVLARLRGLLGDRNVEA